MLTEERYRANISVLERESPDFAKQILQVVMTNLQVMSAEGDGDDKPIIGQIWDVHTSQWINLCDPRDPWAQASNDADEIWKEDARVFVVLGHGLGYFSIELAKRLKPYQRLLILETSPALWKASLHAVDISTLFGGRKIDILIGDNLGPQVREWFLNLRPGDKFGIQAPIHCGHTQVHDRHVYRSLAETALEMIRFHAVSLATWAHHGHQIGQNELLSMPDYISNPGIDSLKDIWKGKPVVCISGGPSLKKNLRLLQDPSRRRKVGVIAIATMYKALLGLGIKPDILTSIDFQELNYTDQFEGLDLPSDIPLVYLHSVHPKTIRHYPGPKFVALNMTDAVSWFTSFLGFKGDAATCQTVAHLSLTVAHVIGASPIMLMGQDLSMPANEHHAPGAAVQDESPEIQPNTHFECEDIYGNTCYTRISFMSMKTVFERLRGNYPETAHFNCTEGGIDIPGFQNGPLENLLALLPEDDDSLISAVSSVHDRLVGRSDVLAELALTNIESVLKDLNELQSLSKDVSIKVSEAIKRMSEDEGGDISKYVDIESMNADIEKYPMPIRFLSIRSIELVAAVYSVPKEGDDLWMANRTLGILDHIISLSEGLRSDLLETSKRLSLLAGDDRSFKGIMRCVRAGLYNKATKLLNESSELSNSGYALIVAKMYEVSQRFEDLINTMPILKIKDKKKERILGRAKESLAYSNAQLSAASLGYYNNTEKVDQDEKASVHSES